MLQVKVAFLIFPLIYRTEPSNKQKSFPGITFVLLSAGMQPSTVGHTTRITWTAAFNKGPGHHAATHRLKGLDTLLKAIHIPWKQQPSSQEHSLQDSCDLQRGFRARESEFKLSPWTHRVKLGPLHTQHPPTLTFCICQMGTNYANFVGLLEREKVLYTIPATLEMLDKWQLLLCTVLPFFLFSKKSMLFYYKFHWIKIYGIQGKRTFFNTLPTSILHAPFQALSKHPFYSLFFMLYGVP